MYARSPAGRCMWFFQLACSIEPQCVCGCREEAALDTALRRSQIGPWQKQQGHPKPLIVSVHGLVHVPADFSSVARFPCSLL